MQQRRYSSLWYIGLVCLLGLCGAAPGLAQQPIHHTLEVVLQPDQHTLQVTDTITLPASVPSSHPTVWPFALHAGLAPVALTPGVQCIRQPAAAEAQHSPPLEHYAVTLPPGIRTLTLRYRGSIHHPVPSQGPRNVWSMADTPGFITSEGVYLSAATSWYPRSGDELVTFTLEVHLPPAWEAVSQGRRARHERGQQGTVVRWESPQVQEDIYVIGGRFTEYSQPADGAQSMVFLRTPEASLAQRYLAATEQYLRLYSGLIGPYPYAKFALVENVWESGYGMPSFTLLGSRVIRLPFIVSTSYAHEILHNWWGNGVFVAAQGGNWSEGLTAYLADHLLQEQRGSATTYRRTTLQKYTDYVTAHQDIPLSAFRARHSAATAAIGYGKALMLFHMLRQELGDAGFVQALRTLYRTHRFQRVGFDALQGVFASVASTDMETIFQQWVTRPGVPQLRVSAATVSAEGQEHVLTAVVEQVQDGPAYRLRVPLAVSLQERAAAWQTSAVMTAKRLEVQLRLPAPPWRLDVDPEFDVLRRLHPDEVPAALSQLLGADRAMLLLPSAAPAARRDGYHQLAQTWSQALSQALEIRWDNELAELPADRAVWLLGWENRFVPVVMTALTGYGVALTPEGVSLEGTTLGRDSHAVVCALRQPASPGMPLAWVAAPSPAALAALGRKLLHYGSYSFLGFAGDEAVNVVKGQWPVLASPMSVMLAPAPGSPQPRAAAALAPRPALSALPVSAPGP